MKVMRVLIYEGSDEWIVSATQHRFVRKNAPFRCERGTIKEVYMSGVVELHIDSSKKESTEKKEKGLV